VVQRRRGDPIVEERILCSETYSGRRRGWLTNERKRKKDFDDDDDDCDDDDDPRGDESGDEDDEADDGSVSKRGKRALANNTLF